MKAKQCLSEEICRLIRGEIDRPVNTDNGGKFTDTLKQLELLRISMRSTREQSHLNEEKLRREIASVAHDLKTPLAVISGYAECLQDGMTDKNYLLLISQKTAAMNEQVVALVDTFRRQSGENCNLAEIINTKEFFSDESEKFIKLAKDKKIKLKFGRIPDVELYGVRNEVARLFENIVSNAVKYTSDGGKIKILFRESAHYFIISVKDSGQGISKKDLPFIFDRFYMADKSRTDSSSSGIGLSIANDIAERCGGEITVKSRENKGSIFKIYLPLDYGTDGAFERFNKLSKLKKFLLFLFLGWGLTSVYRFKKYSETRNKPTLIAGFVFVLLFFIGWIADMINILINGEISLLAD